MSMIIIKKDLTLKNIAENFNLSEEYFSRFFHKSFGITFKNVKSFIDHFKKIY